MMWTLQHRLPTLAAIAANLRRIRLDSGFCSGFWQMAARSHDALFQKLSVAQRCSVFPLSFSAAISIATYMHIRVLPVTQCVSFVQF